MKIQQFTKDDVRGLSAVTIEALRKFSEDHGLNVAYRGSRFSETKCTMKIEFTVQETTTGIDHAEADFNKQCRRFGFTAGHYRKEVAIRNPNTGRNETYRITGFKPANTKYPVILTKVSDGTTWKFPTGRVQQALGEAEIKELGKTGTITVTQGD